MAADGYRVVAVDRCSDDAALDYELASSSDLHGVVEACGHGARAVVCDVADRSSMMLLADEVGVGSFDAAVCAAGVVWGGPPVWQTTPQAWDAVMDTNVTGVLNTAAAVLPAMVRAGTGRFVVVASAASRRGLPRMGAYAASKAAAASLVQSIAADLGSSGVTANAVAPGSVDTEILAASAAVYGLESASDLAVHHTDGKLIDPAEVAATVAWLCSEAPQAVNGSVLAVDAGMTAT